MDNPKLNAISDENVEGLIRRLNEGDVQVAEQLFLYFEPYLRMVVRRRIQPKMRSKFDSTDILQSVWANLITNLSGSGYHFDNKDHLRNFLNRAVVNKFHDQYRHFRREISHQNSLGESELSEIPAINLERPSQIAQHDELWQQMLNACPEKHRDILQFRRDGLRIAEIADRTGLHPSSVRRILYDLARTLKSQNLIDQSRTTNHD